MINFSYFKLLICTLLDNYYKTNKDMTKKVLQNKHPIWKDKTVIDVAGDIGFESIFGTQACRMFVMGNWNKVSLTVDFLVRAILRNECITII